MALPPILWWSFSTPLPYARTLALQERIHKLQHYQRQSGHVHKDYLLLLQHRPVYTAGRRQNEDSIHDERARLASIGADFVATQRGGELTYHGPGQIVGYPLLDLSRYNPAMRVREYVCRMQKMLEAYLQESHGLANVPSEHTGVFLDPVTKVASIGVQVRHHLTSHGFAINITREPLPWFSRVVACGLNDVKAGCVQVAAKKEVRVEDEMLALAGFFGKVYGRDMARMDFSTEGDVGAAVSELEEYSRLAGPWSPAPSDLDSSVPPKLDL